MILEDAGCFLFSLVDKDQNHCIKHLFYQFDYLLDQKPIYFLLNLVKG